MKLVQVNEACVLGALAAGAGFFAGYPITPSTEIAEKSAELFPKHGKKFIQMEDEIASMAAVIGASITGLKALTATSGPGFSLKQELIGYASFAEVPCVIVNVQRHGPSTGLPTSPSQGDVMQARWGTHGDHPIIALSPSSVLESFELTVRAFNLAEQYRVPVILLMDEIVGHLREGINIPEAGTLEVIDRPATDAPKGRLAAYHIKEGEQVPRMPGFGQGYRYNLTGLVHDDYGFPTNNTAIANELCTRLMKKIELNKHHIQTWEEEALVDAEVVVLCYGGTARSVRESVKALREDGVRVGIFRPITIWPFPEERVAQIAPKARHIIVTEHNYGQSKQEVDRVGQGSCPVS